MTDITNLAERVRALTAAHNEARAAAEAARTEANRAELASAKAREELHAAQDALITAASEQ